MSNVAKCNLGLKLNARQCLPAVSFRVLVRGGRGFCAGTRHGLQLGFGCQVIYVLLLLSDSSRCDFIPASPLPLALVSMRQVFVFPLTCQCDGAGWVAAAHRVVMDTLCFRLGLICGLTLLSRHHSPSLSIVDEFKVLLTWSVDKILKTKSLVILLLRHYDHPIVCKIALKYSKL